MDPFPLRGGIVHCKDVPLPTIAREVGTPVYVHSAAKMLSQARSLKSALASLDDPLIAYAVKPTPIRRCSRRSRPWGLAPTFRTAGAYAATMGSPQNSRPLAPEVPVNGADWAVVGERPAAEDMRRGYKTPPWLLQ